jgi:hypothetical protein
MTALVVSQGSADDHKLAPVLSIISSPHSDPRTEINIKYVFVLYWLCDIGV